MSVADDTRPDFVIPSERLPPGFAETVEQPSTPPVTPAPAATIVLLRDNKDGPEVYLMRRNKNVGFVPGAYVFPGGRVDPADAQSELGALTDALPKEPAPAYWMAAVRELFEESGVLLAKAETGPGFDDQALAAQREALLSDRTTLLEILRAGGYRIRLEGAVYFAHWITPIAESRRFDTRFFATALPAGAQAHADARENSDALWLSPAAALQRFRAGRLPMVFPTVRTLEQLAGHATVKEVLARLRADKVIPMLPRLVRTTEGVGIIIDEKE
jgi:8-oxo-dGTP pyrophosphatase MutT (NUDIX family)